MRPSFTAAAINVVPSLEEAIAAQTLLEAVVGVQLIPELVDV
jgi:hypothetical protein